MASPSARRAAAPSDPPAFADRTQAGAALGAALRDILGEFATGEPERVRVPADTAVMAGGRRGRRPRVFALPRGGVPVAVGVARALDAPLDVLVVRKIGHPAAPELGLGALAEDGAGGAGEPFFDQEMLDRVNLTREDLAGVVAAERAELARRVAVYGRAASAGSGAGPGAAPGAGAELAGLVAVVVDDGLATGVTAHAALRAVRARGAARTVLAVPVASPAAARVMKEETDEVVTLVTPRRFRSVGEWYADFGQLTDADVLKLLSGRTGLGRVGAAHAAAALRGALVLVQAAPGPVLLGAGNGVVEALDPDRAARADLLGLALPDFPLWLPLAVWAEEEHQILATTRGSVLPPPVWAGKHGRLPAHLRHGSITSTKLLSFCVTLASGSHARESVLRGNCCCKLQRSTVAYCSRALGARLRAPQ